MNATVKSSVLSLIVGAVVCSTAFAEPAEIEGRIRTLSLPERAMVVLNDEQHYYLIEVPEQVTLNIFRPGKGKKPGMLEQLAEMWSVKVRYHKDGPRIIADNIDAYPVFFYRRPEGKEHAVVQVYYATDRSLPESMERSWHEELEHFRTTLLVAAVTLALSLLACVRKRWPWWTLSGASLLATVVLGGFAWQSRLALTGGPLALDDLYGNERSSSLHLGTCDVSIPRNHKLGTLESPSILRFEFVFDPTKHVTLQQVHERPESEFYAMLRETVSRSKRREAFVFIHGYNVTFASAVRRTAQLAYDLEFDGAAIAYCWPSQAKLLKYTVDESNVAWTVHDLKQFLTDLARRSGARSIHVIAHSMGNRAMCDALSTMAATPGMDMSQFQQIVLAAPDIDAETFKRDIAPALQRAGQRVTLYASSRDEALGISKQIHGYPRAGESGAGLVVVKGLDTIDVSAVDTSFVGHSYYGDNHTLVADLFALMRRGLPPNERPLLELAERRGFPYWVFMPRAELP